MSELIENRMEVDKLLIKKLMKKKHFIEVGERSLFGRVFKVITENKTYTFILSVEIIKSILLGEKN